MRRKARDQATGSAFDVFSDLNLNITEDGTSKKLDPIQTLEQQIFKDALLGKRRAMKMVLDWIAERDIARGTTGRDFPQIFIRDRKPIDVDAAMLILEIASKDASRSRDEGGAYLQLEPWVAQCCVKRTRASSVEDDDLLTSCTRQTESDWTT